MLAREGDYPELVRKAQLGDRDSLNRLAEAARVRLHEYVFRLTLAEDLTQDIIQETILDMLRLLTKLRQADRFWAWLYGIAFNKVRNHYGKEWRHKAHPLPENGRGPTGKTDDVLAEVVTAELKQIVLNSIQRLEPRQRAVLTMRCYDGMSYAEISRLMGCSEIGTRALFYRAKRTLTRLLSGYGLGKGSLLLALVVFGKMTAASEAAAAEVSISAATLSVGPGAALLATTTGKVALVTLTTAGVLAVGSVVATHAPPAAERPVAPPSVTSERPAEPSSAYECWYYFPEGPEQAVTMRLMEFDRPGGRPVCLVLENQHANYCFQRRTNTVHITNSHLWQPDLRVRRLPTDPPALSGFLARVEGGPDDAPQVAAKDRGLLVIYEHTADGKSRIRQADRHPNALQEEYFRFGWPQSAHVVDQRDAMHQRGWTYFTLRGQINGVAVSGKGRVPFTYAASRLHYPWLEFRVGSRVRAVDARDGAVLYDPDGRSAARYAGASLFAGLLRPWMGLHALDTIRRDAAARQLPFQTQYDGGEHATVVVQADAVRLIYTIHLEQDTVERIAFATAGTAGANALSGEIELTYLQDVEGVSTEFPEPHAGTSGTREPKGPGMLWLLQLVQAQKE